MEAAPDYLSLEPAKEPATKTPSDWLGLDEPAGDWLALPDETAGVTTERVDAPYKYLRFQVMQGSSRVWACNGRYVACRPAGFNPATRQRHARFLASGHYRHVGTFDDVQVFELTPESPFYRTEGDVRAGSWYELLRAAAQAAVARDWAAYVDLLEEIATRLKSTPTGATGEVDPGLAKQRFMDTLEHLEQLIFMRWSHNIDMRKTEDYGRAFNAMKAEIDAGVQIIRQRRGEGRSRMIALPSQGPFRIR